MIIRLPFIIIAFLTLIPTRPTSAQVDFTRFVIDSSITGTGRFRDVKAADFDGDTELDLIVTVPDYSGDNDMVYLYRNDGDENFTREIIDTTANNPGRIDIANIDGDLDNDFVLAELEDLSWFDNDGGGYFSREIIGQATAPRIPAVVDLDGDNDLDVVLSGNYIILWFDNDGAQNFDRDTVEVTNIVDMVLLPTDLDGDMDTDILSVVYGSDDDHILVRYQNDGNENFTRDTLDIYGQSIMDLALDDLDDDGDPDIVTPMAEGNTIVWYRNDGTGNFSRDTVGVDFNRYPEYLAIGDIDGDDDKDVIVTGGNNLVGEVVYYENDGSENFAKQVIDDTPGNRQGLTVVDIDKDDDLDIFVTNVLPYEVVFYRNDPLPTGIGDGSSPGIPGGFTLSQNYPNPFNPSTTIHYTIPEAAGKVGVNVTIFDLRGRMIKRLVDEEKRPGSYRVHWDGTDDSGRQTGSGVYIYDIRAGFHQIRRKMVLIR